VTTRENRRSESNLRHDDLRQRRVIEHVDVAVEMAKKRSSHECVVHVEYLVQFRQNVSTVERAWKYAANFSFATLIVAATFTMVRIAYVCCQMLLVKWAIKLLIINNNDTKIAFQSKADHPRMAYKDVLYLLLWPWPWPDDPDIPPDLDILKMYLCTRNKLYRFSQVKALQTDT